MLRYTPAHRRAYRPYYNLPSKSEHGRRMTGFMTPYRHWMWKQNELWRNVHEAQFEHLRKVYKRQWLESFRVNADEYIYKYNITKAAQLAQWEFEMQAQEKKRRENQQLSQGRQALKKKHLDLLREFHERQFFHWYERASERLQYMNYIQYIPQNQMSDHIERELDKYVAGSKEPYPLNFAGQMPMLEDKNGQIVEVAENMMTNYASENPGTKVNVFQPHEGTSVAEEKLLRIMASSQEEELILSSSEGSAVRDTLDELEDEEALRDREAKVTMSMEQTDEDREISRRAYINRGKTGARTIRRPKFDPVTGEQEQTASDATPMKRKTKLDRAHELQKKIDAVAAKTRAEGLKPGVKEETTKVGEIVERHGRLRDMASMPSVDSMTEMYPQIKETMAPGSRIRTQDMLDKRYQRGKYKKGGKDDEDL